MCAEKWVGSVEAKNGATKNCKVSLFSKNYLFVAKITFQLTIETYLFVALFCK